MSIIIYGDLFTFPDGSAATNRVYTYAKGFIKNGINVHVVCIPNDYVEKKDGVMDGIHYYHPFATNKKSKYFIVRRWQKTVSYYRTFSLIKAINKADKVIAINSWSNILTTHLFGHFASRSIKAKFIVECSEHPLRFYQKNAITKRQGAVNFSIEAAISDGVFCISHFLVDFYKSKGVDPRKLFLVPSTVDPERFNDVKDRPVSLKYVGYFGSLTFLRDNVDMLIKAFATFNQLHPDVRLVLGGFCTDSERKEIVDLIAELKIQNAVTLLGYLTREEILQYVLHADILVMVRSNDLQSQASYPSKLTEFLASSKPVISVNVGEIPLYIKDGQHAFLVEPGNAVALAEKLEYVYCNPAIAFSIGQNGKQLTETIFNYKYQAERMLNFIKSL